MWQVLLAAAAAAGSGILAKKLINPTATQNPISDFNQNDQNKSSPPPKYSISYSDDACSQEKMEYFTNDGKIFRFSSSEAASKELRKITRSGFRGPKKNGGLKRGKKKGFVEGGGEERVMDERENYGSGKRIAICLKKRRTGKHVAGKCESCASKDNSFGWGVGLGIMYMMSAGKTEISKLNCAMDETVKTVQQLKAEVSKRKNSHNPHVPPAENESERTKTYLERTHNGPIFTKPSAKNEDIKKPFGSVLSEECGSHSLAKDQKPEVLEMDRLEADFESELQKLPWCATEGSSSEVRTDLFEAGVLTEEHQSNDFRNSNSYNYNGISPAELDEKLSHLLIEQQESQIVDLESELHRAHSKLHEKEAELQALKDCVKRLTEFSLANASDEETEDVERRDGIEEVGFESTKPRVGMKRAMGCES